jgi:hypothetical protein
MVNEQEVKRLVDSSTKQVLVEQAKDLGVDTKRDDGTSLTKPELAERILSAEATYYESGSDVDADVDVEDEVPSGELEENPEPADDIVKPVKVEIDVRATDDAVDTVSDKEEVQTENEVLLRYNGRSLSLQIGDHSFGRENPFRIVSESDADRILDSRYGSQFRVATPREAKEFYS